MVSATATAAGLASLAVGCGLSTLAHADAGAVRPNTVRACAAW